MTRAASNSNQISTKHQTQCIPTFLELYVVFTEKSMILSECRAKYETEYGNMDILSK